MLGFRWWDFVVNVQKHGELQNLQRMQGGRTENRLGWQPTIMVLQQPWPKAIKCVLIFLRPPRGAASLNFECAGTGTDREYCMRLFRAAWERFAAAPARLAQLLDMKRMRLSSRHSTRQGCY